MYRNIRNGYFFLEQLENAGDNFVCAMEAFNTLRSRLKSKGDCKICFRELREGTYTALWMSLLRIKKVDEALFGAHA